MPTWVLAKDGEHVAIVWQSEDGAWYVENNAGFILYICATREEALSAAELEFSAV
jgi:hypothetical protein